MIIVKSAMSVFVMRPLQMFDSSIAAFRQVLSAAEGEMETISLAARSDVEKLLRV
jgi:hypothetical protein